MTPPPKLETTTLERVAIPLAVLALVVGVILVLVACGPPPPPPAPVPHAYLVGDSVAFVAGQNHSFDGFPYPIELHALPGQRLDDPTFSPAPPCRERFSVTAVQPDPRPLGEDLIKFYGAASKPGDWIIVQLGANDLNDGRVCIADTWKTSIESALNSVPPDRCVAWIAEARLGDTARDREWNTWAWIAVHQRPCGVYIPWDRAVQLDHSLVYDGVHPTKRGSDYLVTLLRNGIACRCDQVLG